jgi:hypothetical protein
MKTKIILLRLSYWIAAIADFAIGISVLMPQIVGLDEFVYPMGLMSAVAISWGILLIIADRKPVERRWALFPTIIVVALLNGVRIYATIHDLIESNIMIMTVGIIILLFLIYSYYVTRNIEKGQ